MVRGPLDMNPKENQPNSKTNTNNNSDTNLKAMETLETSKKQPTAEPSKNNKNPDQPAQKTINQSNFDSPLKEVVGWSHCVSPLNNPQLLYDSTQC